MEFSFDLATPDDDPAIRRLLATNPVPGRVTLTYEREPSYFLGCGTMGQSYQVLVARHHNGSGGELAGVACRAVRSLFVNGQVENVGYLGQLRVDKQFRGRWLVPLGFRFLRELHSDGRARGYVTTIIEENVVAQGVLVDRARSALPIYREVGRLCTAALIVRRPGKVLPSPCHISRGTAADLSAIVRFLQQPGANKQFFPVYTEDHFRDNSTTRGFRPDDFVVARRSGEVVGVVGLWDQSSYKQMVVQGYDRSLRWARPFYNVGARWVGAQPLPPPGQPIHFAYASFICIADNDPNIFRALLRHVYNLAAERGYAYLMVGLSCCDPLLAVAREYAHIPYYSRLYTVCWPDGEDFHAQLDSRIPYVEIAAL